MKKLLLASTFIFLVAGCSNDGTEEAGKETSTSTEANVEEEVVEEATDKESVAEEEIAVETEVEILYEIDPNSWSVVPTGDANEKVVLLTVDDAPDKHSLKMAETLKELEVKAIFFVNGHFIDTDGEAAVLKKIYELGFPIGNHTYSHPNLSEITEGDQYKEIVSLNDRIEEIIGERPKYFRAPYGVNTDYSRKVVADENMLLMNWTYGYDWEKEYQNKDALAEIMVNSPFLKNGANLLMHDRAWTSEALADIVKGLQEKGYEIVDPAAIRIPE